MGIPRAEEAVEPVYRREPQEGHDVSVVESSPYTQFVEEPLVTFVSPHFGILGNIGRYGAKQLDGHLVECE